MAEWKRVRLGDVCKVINGRAYSLPELLDDGKYRVLRVGNFFSSDRWYYSNMELAADKYCEKGDLLFAWSASFGPRIWDAEKVIYHYHIWKLVPDSDKVDRLWLYFWLKYSCDNLTASVHGSVMAHMTKVEMEDSMLPLPPLATQRKIAAVLGAIDDKIETNRKMCANLEAQAQALFESWFVDFEPFGGKIPKDWKRKRFCELCKSRFEKASPRECIMYAVTNNGIVPRAQIFNKQLAFSSTPCKLVRKGDLVFGMSRSILNWGVMMYELGGVSSAYHVYDVNSEVSSDYLESYIAANIAEFTSLIKPASREGQGFDVDKFMSMEIILPSARSISSYDDLVGPIIRRKRDGELESRALASMRDALLPKLMSGEIDVEKVEVA